jgi:hypothetical protein
MKKITLFISIFTLLFVVLSSNVLYAKTEENGKVKAAKAGNVQSVGKSSLTIEEKQGNQSDTQVDRTTKVMGQAKKTLRLNQIKPNDKVVVIGTESGTLTKKEFKALKIFVKQASASTSALTKRQAVHGVVTGITGGTITLVHQIHQDRSYTVNTTASTVIKIKGTESATLSSILVGSRIVVVGETGADGMLTAKRIHVIPGLAKGLKLPSGTPTGSGSATITPSVSTTVTPTVTEAASPSATPTTVSPSTTPTPTL